MPFVRLLNGGYVNLDHVVSITGAWAEGGVRAVQLTTNDGAAHIADDVLVQKALGVIVPAAAGWTVARPFDQVGAEDPTFWIEHVVAWQTDGVLAPTPITAEDGLLHDASYALILPNGAVEIQGDRTLSDLDELSAYWIEMGLTKKSSETP